MSPLDDLLGSVGPRDNTSGLAQPKVITPEPLESGSIFDVALYKLSQPGAGKAKMSSAEVGSLAESLVEGWLDYFAKFDRSIQWVAAEEEFAMWLCDAACESCHGTGVVNGVNGVNGNEGCPESRTLLVGRIDAVGRVEAGGELFFGEWKTSKPPWKTRREEWKTTWLMSPQSLTYGVAADRLYPGIRRFTVRRAYKSNPPTYDYAWFRYGEGELAWWRGELLNIADEIRARRKHGMKGVPWAPNFERCFKYGAEYVCPRFHPCCSQLNWNGPIEGSTERVSHLAVEQKFLAENVGTFGQPMRKGVVVLDATRIGEWMECREKYRGVYELGVREPGGEALEVGSDFHSLLKTYYGRLK